MISFVISELWLNPAWYNFTSSEWGGLIFKVVEFVAAVIVIRVLLKPLMKKIHKHMECNTAGCEKWGWPIHNTSFRACHEHHPHLKEEGHSVEEIEHAAKHGHYAGD